jgi:hypothetical protein
LRKAGVVIDSCGQFDPENDRSDDAKARLDGVGESKAIAAAAAEEYDLNYDALLNDENNQSIVSELKRIGLKAPPQELPNYRVTRETFADALKQYHGKSAAVDEPVSEPDEYVFRTCHTASICNSRFVVASTQACCLERFDRGCCDIGSDTDRRYGAR